MTGFIAKLRKGLKMALGDRRDILIARRPAWLRFGFSLLLTVIAAIASAAISPLDIGPSLHGFYMAAVMLSALYGGIGPGLFSTFLGALLSVLFGDHVEEGIAILRLGMFIVEGTAVSWIIGNLQHLWRVAELSRISAKHLEEVARRSEEKFRLLVENVQDYAIFMLDPNGKIISWNSGAQRTLGYRAHEILGQHISTFYPPEVAQTLPQQVLQRAVQEGRTEDEGWRIRKDGSRFWSNSILTALFDQSGKVRGFSKITRDITERRKAEELFRGLLESAPDAMIICDQDGRIILVNSQTEKLLGYDRQELIGKDVEVIVPLDLRDLHTQQRQQYMRSSAVRGMGANLDIHARKRDGSSIPVEISLSPVDTSDGIVIAAAVRDSQERTRVAQELKHGKAEAEAASAAKDQFLAVLSHELRTPLTPALLTASAVAASEELSSAVRDDVETIRRNIELEARLIDDLLDITRISRGKLVMHTEDIDIHELLHAVVDICHDEIEAKSLLLTMDLRCERCIVRGDRARLHQVFWNLLKNAIKFTPRHGWIRIKTSFENPADAFNRVLTPAELPGAIIIQISDSGIGIDPDSLPKIFGVFEQADVRITRQFGGLGLGLAISKNLIELHNGKITASSDGKNKGSTFTIELPLVQSPTSSAPTPPPQPSPPVQGNSLRILLVEDHPDTLRSLTRLLRQAGYSVTPVRTAAQAIEMSAKESFDLVISDIGLPDGDGNQLMRRLKHERQLRGIALSGYGSDEDLAQHQDAGFQEHLTKPVTIDQLQQAIDRVSRSPSS